MMDSAPAIIAYIGRDERYRQANAAYLRWFGIKPEDIIGRSFTEVFGTSLYEAVKPKISRALSGERVSFEQRHATGLNSELILEITYTPDIDEHNVVQGYTELGNDVTARREAELALRRSEERWRNLFDQMAEGFFLGEILYDANGRAHDFRFLEVNPSFQKITGIEHAPGQTAMQAFPNLESDLLQIYAGVVETGAPAQFELQTQSLGQRWFAVSARKTSGPQFSVLFSDISERKRIAEQLKASEARTAALTLLGDQLRDPRDVPSLTLTAMEVIGKALGVTRAGYGLVDRTGEYVTIHHDWTAHSTTSIAGCYRFRDFGELLAEKLQRGEFVVVDDTSTNPTTACEAERWKLVDIGAVINFPLVEAGRLSAILFLHDSKPRQWSEADLTFVRKAADRTWAAVERARVLRDLQDSEEFARGVLASSPDCVEVLELDGRLLSINRNGCDLLEIEDPAEFIGKPWLDAWGESDTSGIDGAMARAREGEIVHFDGFFPTRKGTAKWWETVIAPVKNAAGRTIRLLAISRDITRRRMVESERERLTLELKRSNEELSGFAHIVAHDLQSPLRGINSFAQLLGRDASATLSDREREFLSHIVENARRMQTLVEALLRFAQVGQGKIEPRAVLLDGVVNTALHNLRLEMEEAGALVTRGALPSVKGDGILLAQLLQNLIGNALKYRRQDRPPQIGIHAVQDNSRFVIAVEDNGQGIPERYLEQIFEPLKRLHGAEIPGSGLGLSVCRKIVERHGGRIWADSTPDVGSTFFFTLDPA